MGFIKSALGMVGDAATGGLASGIGGLVSGLFGGGTSVKDQKKIMAEQAKYEKENMKYQSELNEAMAQANQQRAYDYFNMTANYNSAKNQKARLEEAGLNPALMYGQAGSGGAGTGETGGAQGQGVGLAQAQGIGMALQLKSINAQTKLAEANAAKAYAEANKIAGVESKKTDAETKNIKQEIEESKNRIKDILAGIPQKEEAYYVQKAQEKLFESMSDLNKISGELNEENKKKVNMETHVLTKTYERIESEIENIDIDTKQKKEIIDLLRDRMKSEINLNIAKAFEASAKAKLSEEQIKTVDAQIGLWEDQADFWGATIENQREQIENQVLQWGKEWELEREKLTKEEIEAVVNSIFQAINIVHGLGGKVKIKGFAGR